MVPLGSAFQYPGLGGLDVEIESANAKARIVLWSVDENCQKY